MQKQQVWFPGEILLPDFVKYSGSAWSVIACDQHTSEIGYWEETEKTREGSPSTLDLILPEVWLSESGDRIPGIHRKMEEYLHGDVLHSIGSSMIYLERTLADGRVRHGVIGAIDLEMYDYNKGSVSLVRATEATVLERIPPRVAVRRGAALELPHVLLLIDDPEKTVIEPLAAMADSFETLYDFDLMMGGGHVRGRKLTQEAISRLENALSAFVTPAALEKRYGNADLKPLLFAVGDGNHSLASAKAYYEEIKQQLGDEAKNHPARYALCEFVNLHEDVLEFEPIYRVLFGVVTENLLRELKEYAAQLSGNAPEQKIQYVTTQEEGEILIPHPVSQLPVGSLQVFLDEYLAKHPEVKIDYIHGEETTRALVNAPDRIGFLFLGMQKDQLFRTVIYDGALPRKTFSMGHAEDKRYYLECRKIMP